MVNVEGGSILDPAGNAGRTLRARGLTVALAESCTAGLLGHKITGIAGSSDYFFGAVVAYDNSVKEGVLGVKPSTLKDYGAVSEQCAIEMAQGTRALLKTDIGLSVTGIAGPAGGTEEKPVGTVFLAFSAGDVNHTLRLSLKGNRDDIKEASATEALKFLLDELDRYD